MKGLKKILVVALFAMISSFAFADYDGDLQIRFGYAFGNFTINSAEGTVRGSGLASNINYKFTNDEFQKWDAKDFDKTLKLSNFAFGLANYNTWMIIPKYLGLGFMYGTQIDVGGIDNSNVNFNAMIGPAVSTTLGEIVRLETAVGLNIGIGLYSLNKKITQKYYGYDVTLHNQGLNILLGVGFGWDISAVFFPKAAFSPIIGFNLTTTSGSGLTKGFYTSRPENSGDGYQIDYDFKATTTKFTIFIGGAFNFGRD